MNVRSLDIHDQVQTHLLPGFDSSCSCCFVSFCFSLTSAVFLMPFLCLLKRRKKLCSLLNLCLSFFHVTICQLCMSMKEMCIHFTDEGHTERHVRRSAVGTETKI